MRTRPRRGITYHFMYLIEVLPFVNILVDNFTPVIHHFKAIRNPIKVVRHIAITAHSW